MVGPSGRLGLALAACLAAASLVAAQEAKPLVLGFAELASDGPGAGALAILIPGQLRRRTSFIAERHETAAEAEAARVASRDSRLETLREAVTSAQAARDLKALSVRSGAKRRADIVAAETVLAKARADLAAALGEPWTPTPANPEARALTRWKGHADGRLLPVALDPAAVCAAEGLDLLVRGRVSSIGGSLYAVELSLYVAALGRDVWSDVDYASEDGVAELIEAFASPLAAGLLGRPYARLAVRATPSEADVYLGGRRLLGDAPLFLAPELATLSARARGYGTAEARVLMEPGRDERVELSLTPLWAPGFSVESEPSGAAVHVDGQRLGFTPLDIPGTAYARVIRLSMEGYEPAQLVADPASLVEGWLVNLAPSDGRSFDERYDAKKSAFYTALGWFIVALPVPVLSGGLFQTYYQTLLAIKDTTSSGAIDAAQAATIERSFYFYQTVFWVSSAGTVGCLVNAAFKLAAYLETAR